MRIDIDKNVREMLDEVLPFLFGKAIYGFCRNSLVFAVYKRRARILDPHREV